MGAASLVRSAGFSVGWALVVGASAFGCLGPAAGGEPEVSAGAAAGSNAGSASRSSGSSAAGAVGMVVGGVGTNGGAFSAAGSLGNTGGGADVGGAVAGTPAGGVGSGGAGGSTASGGGGAGNSAACAMVNAEYAAELDTQLACNPNAGQQCTNRAAAAPGCECRVFIQPADPFAIEHLSNVANAWFTADCSMPSCPAKCSTAAAGTCQADSKSPLGGRCLSP